MLQNMLGEVAWKSSSDLHNLHPLFTYFKQLYSIFNFLQIIVFFPFLKSFTLTSSIFMHN